MKDILVLAYAISPSKGSEYAVAWNYVTAMSRYHRLTVLYGTSGEHMGDTVEMERYIWEHPVPNVTFVAVAPSRTAERLNALNKRGIFVYSFYLAYRQWHKSVYRAARELVRKKHFDLIHYVGPIGYREPGYLWKLDLPYVWGPIGGTRNPSFRLLGAVSTFPGLCKLLFRTVANVLQLHFGRRIRLALRRTDVLLTATTENRDNIRRVHRIDSIWLPENGVAGAVVPPDANKFTADTLHFIWIGRIDNNKALIVLLDALQLVDTDSPVVVHVVGDGPLRPRMERYAGRRGVGHLIRWHGKVSRTEVFELLRRSHLHIISSLSEGNPTTIWEAMSCGVPTMSLDHCGMHDVICDRCGIRIPIRSYAQVVRDMGAQMQRLIRNPHLLKTLSEGVLECIPAFRWENRIELLNELYDKAIENYERSRK